MRPAPSEEQWQATVVDLARLCRWRVLHIPPSYAASGRILTHATAGWPDLVLWRPGRILFRELKTDTGRLTAVQADVLASLEAAGGDVAVWRPRDWETVQATLRAR